MTKIAIVFDRDGTLIQHIPYLCDPAKITLLPGVKEGLKGLISENVLLFLHTNQSGVGRGLFTMEAVHACNSRMIELLDLGESPFEKICIAPESPEQPSLYRKPSRAFADEIMSEFHLEPSEVWYVGDRCSDLQVAEMAGIRAVGLLTGLDDLENELATNKMTGYSLFDRFDLAMKYIMNQHLAT
jgi:D-glycero-D-manno-heptose 1,7-bisphosphate phosphatase